MDSRLDQKAIIGIETSDDIDLRRLIVALFDRWRLIMKCTVAAVVVAILFILQATPTYRATAKLLIDTRQQRVLASEDILPVLAVDASVIESQVELLTSTTIAHRVLSELEKQSTAPENTENVSHTDKQIQDFLSRLVVSRIGLTYLIDVSYSSPDPNASSQIANAVARAYIEEEAEAKIRLIERANLWLQDRIKQLAPQVRTLEEKIHDYRANNKLLELGDQSVTERIIVNYIQQLSLARAALAEAEATLALNKERSVASLQSQNDYEVAKTKVSLMEHGIDTLINELMSRKKLAIQLGELEREATAVKGLYESLLKRQRETDVQQNLQTVNARIVQEALPPAYPSWPKKTILLVVFTAAGIVLGILCVIAEVILKDGAYSRRDVMRHVGLPCDLAIPLVKIPRAMKRKPQKRAQEVPLMGALTYAVNHRQTRFSQIFRLILQKTRERTGPAITTIAVISPRSGDGKTLTASNLAFTAGDLGERVLLLDISLDKDLSTMVGYTRSGEDSTRGEIVELQNGASKIHFFGWPKNQNSECMLPANAVEGFISQVRQDYSIIIIDTAPLSEDADTLQIVQKADAVILVVSKAQTPLRDVRSMISIGNLVNKTILTLILNRASSGN